MARGVPVPDPSEDCGVSARVCFNCRDKRPIFPPERPMFCTQRCAAEYAAELIALSEDWVWCPVHRDWEANDPVCACEEAGR